MSTIPTATEQRQMLQVQQERLTGSSASRDASGQEIVAGSSSSSEIVAGSSGSSEIVAGSSGSSDAGERGNSVDSHTRASSGSDGGGGSSSSSHSHRGQSSGGAPDTSLRGLAMAGGQGGTNGARTGEGGASASVGLAGSGGEGGRLPRDKSSQDQAGSGQGEDEGSLGVDTHVSQADWQQPGCGSDLDRGDTGSGMEDTGRVGHGVARDAGEARSAGPAQDVIGHQALEVGKN